MSLEPASVVISEHSNQLTPLLGSTHATVHNGSVIVHGRKISFIRNLMASCQVGLSRTTFQNSRSVVLSIQRGGVRRLASMSRPLHHPTVAAQQRRAPGSDTSRD